MTEEEQKAIEIVDDIAFSRGIRQDVDGRVEDLKAIKDVLRLVDNKQKEIEVYIENNAKIKQLKEEKNKWRLYMELSLEEKETLESLRKNRGVSFAQADIISKLIDNQQKELEDMREELQMYVDIEENFDTVYMKAVADFKDKIREKIKDLEKIIEYDKPTYIETLEYTIEILQELLED